MARRKRRSWLAKRAEPGTHVPITHTAPKAPLLARKKASDFFICVFAPTTIGGTGRVGGGLRGAVPHQSPSTQLNYALQVCFSRLKLIRGSEKSTVDLYFSLLTK